jgi:hypothetical protein
LPRENAKTPAKESKVSDKKSAPKKAAKKASKPKPENQIKALQGRLKRLEDRVENLVAVLSNRLNFNADNEPVDIIETGEKPEAPADEEPEAE